MQLKNIVSEIRTGDVLLFRYPERPRLGMLLGWLVSWIIGLRTRSVYSHVGVAIWMAANGTKRLALFEATSRHGVRTVPLDRYLERSDRDGYRIEWYQVTNPTINREGVASYCLDQWDSDYASLLQMSVSFGLIGRLLRKVFGWRADLNTRRFFCSRLMAAAFQHAGYVPPEGDETDPALTDPGACSRYTCLTRRGIVFP